MSKPEHEGFQPARAMTRNSELSLAALRARFLGDERGTVAMIFGMSFVPSLLFLGMAVDYGRINVVRQNTQTVLDAAALAAARAYQAATPANRKTDAETAAHTTWAAMNAATVSGATNEFKGAVKHAIPNSSTMAAPVYGANDTELTLSVQQWVKTPFISAIDMLDRLIPASAKEANSPAECTTRWFCQSVKHTTTVRLMQKGGSEGEYLEASVMLDITGSMREAPGTSTYQYPIDDPRSKLYMMKKAAKAFVDILLPEKDDEDGTRIALVPFGIAVYPGADIVSQIIAAEPQGGCTINVAGCQNFTFTQPNKTNDSDAKTWYRSPHCVTVRQGNQAYTDAAPSSESVEWLYSSSKYSSGTYQNWGQCTAYDPSLPSRNKIVPLNNDPAILKAAITNLTSFGSTAGHIGTAWTWYMLSPNWASIWPAANRPRAHDPKVKKVAVLMTDGEFNTQYCKGVDTDTAVSKSNTQRSQTCTAKADSNPFFSQLCTNMKQQGITIYTIGFDVGTNPQTLLRNCATSPAHAYNAVDEASIMTAFKDIALKTSRIVVFK